jgi:hypothetical protein
MKRFLTSVVSMVNLWSKKKQATSGPRKATLGLESLGGRVLPSIAPVTVLSMAGNDFFYAANSKGELEVGKELKGLQANGLGISVDVNLTTGLWSVIGVPIGTTHDGQLVQGLELDGPEGDAMAKWLYAHHQVQLNGINSHEFLPISPAEAAGLPPDNPARLPPSSWN